MIGVDRVVLNAIVGEARRRRTVPNTVFAAFFSAKDATSCQARGHRSQESNHPLHKHVPRAQVDVPEVPISATAHANARMLE